MPRRGGQAAEVVVISWRDIPAQVNGQAGRERHQLVLSSKFQRAIDRAKRKANIYTAEEDIAQWHRVSAPVIDGDIVAAAEAEAARLESELTREYLGKLAYAGGFVDDMDDAPIDRAELLALEELDEDDEFDNPSSTARQNDLSTDDASEKGPQ